MCRPSVAEWVAVLTICVSCLLGLAAAETGEDAKALRKQLFITNDYDKKTRSSNNQTEVKVVDASLFLMGINELDDVKEILQTTCQLVLNWTDDFLQWDPEDAGGVYAGHWPQEDVWKPGVALMNSYTGYVSLSEPGLNVQVTPDGQVLWVIFKVFRSTCSVNIKYYPYDVQECELIFAALGYNQWEVVLLGGIDGMSLDIYEKSALWDIESTSVWVVPSEIQFEPVIVFKLTLRRKPLYVMLTIVVPIMLLMVLNIVVFILPADSGEKASYAITVFLAFAVFLTIISTTLPKNSESVSILSVYLLTLAVQSTVITLVTLVLIRIGANGADKPVPRTLVHILRCFTCKRNGGRMTNTVGVAHDSENTKRHKVSNNERDFPSEKAIGDSGHDADMDWKEVVDGLDRICLLLFATTALSSTMCCLFVISTFEPVSE